MVSIAYIDVRGWRVDSPCMVDVADFTKSATILLKMAKSATMCQIERLNDLSHFFAFVPTAKWDTEMPVLERAV